jgi:hypothetical protein
MFVICENFSLHGLDDFSGVVDLGSISAVQLNFDLTQFARNFTFHFLFFLYFHNYLFIIVASSVIPSKYKWICPLDLANSNLPQ